MKYFLLFILSFTLNAETFFYEYGEKIHLTESKTRRSTDKEGLTYYTTSTGHRMASTGEIILKVQSFEQLNHFLTNYPITSYQKLDSKTYLLEPQVGTDLFALANQLHVDPMSAYAQPNFIREKRGR